MERRIQPHVVVGGMLGDQLLNIAGDVEIIELDGITERVVPGPLESAEILLIHAVCRIIRVAGFIIRII